MLYDISPPLSSDTPVFPGDTPLSREVLLDISRGDHITLSTMHSTVHIGAHVDAPSHYGRDSHTIDQQLLDIYIGPCQVIETSVTNGELVRKEHISAKIAAERVLLRTGTFPDPTQWTENYAGLDPVLVDDLARQGVRLVGIDTPSVDPASSQDLPAHQRFLANDMAILEGVVLDNVPAGLYELIALPLKLVGFDASPVRAVLRPL